MITAMNRIYVVPEYAEQLELHDVFTDSSQPDLEPEPHGSRSTFTVGMASASWPLILLLCVGCTHRDSSLVGTWEAFTETHMDETLDLGAEGDASFVVEWFEEDNQEPYRTETLAGRWRSEGDTVIVQFPEGEARYLYSPDTEVPFDTSSRYRGLTPIDGTDLGSDEILWNPPLMEQAREAS